MTIDFAVERQRRENYAVFLRALPSEKWDYREYVTEFTTDDKNQECGSICCAIGWLPAHDPGHWMWHTNWPGTAARKNVYPESIRDWFTTLEGTVAKYFGMDCLGVRRIFYHAHLGLRISRDQVTPSQIADLLLAAPYTHDVQEHKLGALALCHYGLPPKSMTAGRE